MSAVVGVAVARETGTFRHQINDVAAMRHQAAE